MTTACALAFGGNSAESEALFQQAIIELAKAETICQSFAKPIQSAAMGVNAGSEFLNSAGIFQTHLSPDDLLKTIHKIEFQLGRKRELRWGPRPIDIDVLFYGQQIIDTATIVIPHPCLWYRSFVLKPLNEVSPNWIHPIFNESVAQLTHRLTQRPLLIRLQDQQTDLHVSQIAQQCWSIQDHPFHLLSTDDQREAFCEIMIESTEQKPTVLPSRRQPCHESRRIIRCFVGNNDGAKTVRQFLMDTEAAVLG